MARKRPNPLDDPPAASSSEEEDEDEELPEQHEVDKRPADASESEEAVGDEDDEDEEEVDEEEPEKEKIRPPHKPVSKIPNPQADESETESESAGFTLRPHTSTPASASAAKPRNPLKRPVEGEKESKSKAKKKAKPDSGGGGESGVAGKKSGIIRLWSDEDEIAVLKGMIEFHEKKGVDPNSDSTTFHEFVKKSISVDVSKNQLMEKVRRLKNKYRYNAEKAEDPVFSRPHERKAFELSKTIWGSVGGNVVKNASIKKKNSSTDHSGNFDVVMALPNPNFTAFNTISNQEPPHSKVAFEQGKFSDLYPFLYMSLKSSSLAMMSRDMAETMERWLVSKDKSKLQELDKEWKKQILDEAQVSMRRSDLLKKQLLLLLADWHSTRG